MKSSSQSGFTLVETLIAIFILALTIGALLTLTAGGFFSIRYAKNDIVASNLLQESLEYIRNTRDSAYQEGSVTWDTWKQQYDACFGSDGCTVQPYPAAGGISVLECNGDCDPLEDSLEYHTLAGSTQGIYLQQGIESAIDTDGVPIKTSFVRTIRFENAPSSDIPGVKVTARMDWKNGTYPKHLTQSIILTPWNIQQ